MRTWKISRSSPSVMPWYSTQTICLFANSRRYFSGKSRRVLADFDVPVGTSLYHSFSLVRLEKQISWNTKVEINRTHGSLSGRSRTVRKIRVVMISLHTGNLKWRVNIRIFMEDFKLTKPSINLRGRGLSEQMKDSKVNPVPMNRSQPLLSINTCFAFGPVLEGVDSEDNRRDIKVSKDRVNYSDLLGFRPNHVCKTDPKINFPNDRDSVKE
jgi:hypothetical protein